MITDTVILARGGSKGIPGKNIIDFCGKPLLAWTIEQCMSSKYIRDVWVSSDSVGILDVATQYGAKTILRPAELSDDYATSESGWLHAIDYIEQKNENLDVVLAPQVTSPLRETLDVDRAIEQFINENNDSLFSCSVAEDLFFWERNNNGMLNSINYNYKNRKRRQDIPKQVIENGSFYLFKTEVLRKYNNRFGGNIGCTEMEFWKMFEIDGGDDVRMCSALMNEFLIGNNQ
ncbi:MAG: acylneuraminate cytidylyltransferase family protein [Gammaproteobacteria bacterium]|nr:acylneuraminate cytidylyltransferase family protein [Gammaproteobacteria bacterium]